MMILLNNRIRIACFLLFTQLFNQATQAGELPLSVLAVNYPLYFFAQTIGGEQVRAELPLPPGIDPAYWSPGPEEITVFQEADLILRNGADYAGWMTYATLPRRKQVNTSAGFKDRYLLVEDRATHNHGPSGDHSHRAIAFTTWLDISLAAQQASVVMSALAKIDPAHQEVYAGRFSDLKAKLHSLDRRMRAVGEFLTGESVIFSHPVYQYLERAYGIKGLSLHWEPNEEPDESQWASLQQIAAANGSRLMIWEGDPTAGIRDRLHALGIQVVVFDPMANLPEEGDFLTGMEQNILYLERVAAVLRR